MEFTKNDFGNDFFWGAAQASYQTEGAWNIDGKSESVWDKFAHTKGKIERNENADIATDFYHKYEEDIELLKSLNFKHFRFSVSWPRILPQGTGEINKKGIEFYHKVIDKCIKSGIEPWLTIYHWDHPQILEDQGGWTNRKMIDWFSEYTEVLSKEYGSKVKYWMILNEPLSFTGGGYLFGDMAPGRKGLRNFRKAVHHANLCQAEAARIVRKNAEQAIIGTTHLTSYIEAISTHKKHLKAVAAADALFNRMFIEPSLGMGYPDKEWKYLRKMKNIMLPGDIEKMKFDFDFIGLQYYFRTVVKKAFVPFFGAKIIPPSKRNVPANEMEGEIFPEGLYHLIKKFADYPGVKKIVITENGTCVKDILKNGKIEDTERINYFKEHLQQVLRAKNEGINIDGYFVWSLTDNFEWNKGYRTRFGINYVDYNTQKRYTKDSGNWFKELLK